MFYLGTHEAGWLRNAHVPLMVSRVRLKLATAKQLAYSPDRWTLDSGGFTELQKFGEWRINAGQYAFEVLRAVEEIGCLDWAAPQDWMCEPAVIHGGTFNGQHFVGTGLSVREHQARTVGNYLDLRALSAPVIPVLQGYQLGDYLDHVDQYARAGINLAAEPTVGLGSVCRRQDTAEIGSIVGALHDAGITRLHGFGCKEGALRRYGGVLASADSMAWSKGGRNRGTCTHLKSRCANHLHWALDWRSAVLAAPRVAEWQRALPIGLMT